jgi:hypothetical protein
MRACLRQLSRNTHLFTKDRPVRSVLPVMTATAFLLILPVTLGQPIASIYPDEFSQKYPQFR